MEEERVELDFEGWVGVFKAWIWSREEKNIFGTREQHVQRSQVREEGIRDLWGVKSIGWDAWAWSPLYVRGRTLYKITEVKPEELTWISLLFSPNLLKQSDIGYAEGGDLFIWRCKHGANHYSLRERTTCETLNGIKEAQEFLPLLTAHSKLHHLWTHGASSLSRALSKSPSVPPKLKIEVPYAVLWGLCPKELKTETKTSIFTQILKAALFTRPKR